MDINVQVTVTIPALEMQSYEAWNFGKNLLKSSLEPTRQIGYDLCSKLLDVDEAMGHPVTAKRLRLSLDLANRNPA